jgi:hypothetical protein
MGKIIGFEDYYFENKHILCMRAFSVAAVISMINDGTSPTGSTKLDDETGHNCKMLSTLYKSFCHVALSLNHNSWAITQFESAFCNLILQDNNCLVYYYDADTYCKSMPFSYNGDLTNMSRILVQLTLLLISTNVYTPNIINSVWGEDANARLVLGGPRGDLSLIQRKILSLSKVAIKMVHIWMTDPSMPVLQANLDFFKRLPPTVQQLLHQRCNKIVFAQEPVPPGTAATQLPMNNLRNYLVPDTLPFKEKAICWYCNLLLNNSRADDMTGFDNGILMAYTACVLPAN